MKLVDANVMIYAVNSDVRQHAISRTWLDAALNGDEAVALPWLCLIAFTRLATHPSIFPAPMTTDAALEQVSHWLSAPPVVPCAPGPRHVDLWRDALRAVGGGNLVNDAHLAALAIEYNATIVTFDTDFALFPGVRWQIPGGAINGQSVSSAMG